MSVETPLVELLACPCEDHGALSYTDEGTRLSCDACARSFPVEDGIPVLILEKATRS